MKKRTIQLFAGATLGALLMTGCSAAVDSDDATSSTPAAIEETAEATTEEATDTTEVESIALEDRVEANYADLDIEEVDLDYSTAGATEIALADGASSVDGAGATVDGDTITISESGTYVLSGELSAGQVVVNGDGADVVLVLDGVDITSPDVAGINVVDADWVVLALADGSSNSVADASGAVDDDSREENAAIYATSDLWITGTGALDVTGVAADGITSKDTLVIDSGTVNVTATDDGIRGKDHLVVLDGDITVSAGGDGLKADNVVDSDDATYPVGVVWIAGGALTVDAGTDAIDAENQVTVEDGSLSIAAGDDGITTNGIMRISGGSIDVTESVEGFEAALMYLDDGSATITSSDDAINGTDGSGSGEQGGPMGGGMDFGGTAPDGQESRGSGTPGERPGNESETQETTTTAQSVAMPGDSATEGVLVEISGGTWALDARGDGLDSNGDVLMTGGTVVVAGPTNSGNGAVDYNGTFTMDGGTFLASGAAGMAQAPDDGEQGVIGVAFGQTLASGSSIAITDADGELVAAYTFAKESGSVVVSSPDVASGETYTVTHDGTVAGDGTAGLVTEGSVSGGEELGTVEAS